MKFLLNYLLFETTTTSNPSLNITEVGKSLVKELKTGQANKGEWKFLPCYAFVYEFINKFKKLNTTILSIMKMPYPKDLNSLTGIEATNVAKKSLEIPLPSDIAKMGGLKYINDTYHIGKIVDVNSAKIGDAINFWVYVFTEFTPSQNNYSSPETKKNFENYISNQKKKNINFKYNPNDWFIEGITLSYGHYGIISDIDSKYLYLSSSGEKKGVNGIWNGVPKESTEDMFTKVNRADILKFNFMKYDDIIFKRSDDISGGRTKLVLRANILNFIN